MKPWNETQFKLEAILEKLLVLETEDKDVETVGNFILTNIALCKDIHSLVDRNQQEMVWRTIESDFNELFVDLDAFLKEKKIN